MDGALFVEKLRREEINNEIVEYSKNTFFYSDEYIHKLKLCNMPYEQIENIFGICHQVYVVQRYEDYRINKDSEQFVRNVMAKIGEIQLQGADRVFPPQKIQKTGLIHLLANDQEMDIKWGAK